MSGSINTFEVIGVFRDRADLERATRALEGVGIGRSRLSLLGTPEAAGADLGLPLREPEAASSGEAATAEVTRKEGADKRDGARDVAGLVSSVPAYVGATLAAGAVVATGGALAPVVTAAVAGAAGGAAAGGGLAGLLPDDPPAALSYERELRDGGVLLFVTLEHAGEVNEAKRVLEEHAAHSVRTQVVTS
jgi:hypothetical protein